MVVRAEAGAKSLDRFEERNAAVTVEGHHVGLDVYDLLTEALMRALRELATPEAYRPPGIGWSSVGLANLRVPRTAELLASGDAEVSSTRRREYTRLCNNSRQL
jgi:hypothetical protein